MHSSKLVWITPNAQNIIAYCARVSSKKQNNPNILKLLQYCATHGHWSIFEMASVCVEITTTRAISPQILRHRSFSFQEFCISGDSRVRLKERNSMKISDLYNRQQRLGSVGYNAKVFDEDSQSFVWRPIKEVFNTGVKGAYKYTTDKGKTITCTPEHKVLTKEGFMDIKEAVNRDLEIGHNGSYSYQTETYLRAKVSEGMTDVMIARDNGVSPHTIRKWRCKYNIGNKQETLWQHQKCSTGLSFESKVWSYRKYRSTDRPLICESCGLGESRIELSHKLPTRSNPELAFEDTNTQWLCASCHAKFDYQEQGKTHSRRGRQLTVKWGKIVSVEYVGDIPTYDLEVEHTSHNYVADGLVVHNSQRYSDPSQQSDNPLPSIVDTVFEQEIRLQDTKNRQNSIELDSEQFADFFDLRKRSAYLAAQSEELYNDMLEAGVAKEVARGILPMNTPTRLYMSGTIRSWIHYLRVRADAATQKEHRLIALSVLDILRTETPIIHQFIHQLKND